VPTYLFLAFERALVFAAFGGRFARLFLFALRVALLLLGLRGGMGHA
jgi:hypothetical protein